MNRTEAQAIANENNLGVVYFEYRVAENTGKEIEVGYVGRQGRKVLFCKRGSRTTEDGFYLCNEFEPLKKDNQT